MDKREFKLSQIKSNLPVDKLRKVSESVDFVRSQKGFWTTNFKQVTPEEIASLEAERPTTRLLSIHVINGCNLACRACNHNSSLLGVKSGVDIDALMEDIKEFLPKVYVWSHISIIGGEPLLEPRTREVVKVTREVAEATGQTCNIKLFSNGSRLIQEQEWIADEMLKGVNFRLTFHKPWFTELGSANWENAAKFIRYLQSRDVDTDNLLEFSEAFRLLDGKPRQWFDLVRYEIKEDQIKYYPFEEGNPEESFTHCTCPNSQLYNGHLWKCPMISYLRESLDATDQLNDPEWQKYLAYKPTDISASPDDIRASFDEVKKPHEICSMCPHNPVWFTATAQLDAKLKKNVAMHDEATYDTV